MLIELTTGTWVLIAGCCAAIVCMAVTALREIHRRGKLVEKDKGEWHE